MSDFAHRMRNDRNGFHELFVGRHTLIAGSRVENSRRSRACSAVRLRPPVVGNSAATDGSSLSITVQTRDNKLSNSRISSAGRLHIGIRTRPSDLALLDVNSATREDRRPQREACCARALSSPIRSRIEHSVSLAISGKTKMLLPCASASLGTEGDAPGSEMPSRISFH